MRTDESLSWKEFSLPDKVHRNGLSESKSWIDYKTTVLLNQKTKTNEKQKQKTTVLLPSGIASTSGTWFNSIRMMTS